MLDLWPRSYAVADSCRDSCEHWPELCKPTLITSFLSVPDKRSDTPDKHIGMAETHPGSLVIVLSHYRERRCADRLRRKFPRKEEKRTNLCRMISFPVAAVSSILSSFRNPLDPLLNPLIKFQNYFACCVATDDFFSKRNVFTRSRDNVLIICCFSTSFYFLFAHSHHERIARR